ncbi:hypothetical protein OAM42_04805 [Candidatus Thioglobus sp.]|nr:hypothetical protein [Candidatus Thioglobus sp.]
MPLITMITPQTSSKYNKAGIVKIEPTLPKIPLTKRQYTFYLD